MTHRGDGRLAELAEMSLKAREYAYAPYSNYAVGAALMCTDGTVYSGCNVENAAYGPSNCAERTAFFKAVSEGKQEFTAIAVAGGKAGHMPESFAFPCGVCRQVMKEFCEPDFKIVVVISDKQYDVFTLKELLPHGFGGEHLI